MLRDLFDFFLPRRCHVCGAILNDSERYLCISCRSHLPRTLYHTLPLNPMEEKLAGGVPFERATAHFYYAHDSAVAQLVQDFKYRQFPGLARELGRVVGEELLPTGFFNDIHILEPIPLHLLKYGRRGYNQAEELAIGICEATGLQLGDHLRARRYHTTQTRLSAEEREKNVSGYFAVCHGEELENLGVAVIDDVCTTGSTLRNAGAALSGIPGLRLYYLTLAGV